MFRKATKEKSKLRLALYGISGAGKTYSSLAIAKGLGNKIALIDTEFGSASKYSDLFNFDTAKLEVPTINNLVMLIEEAQKQYDVIIIDSLTHAWQELLQENAIAAKVKFGGNTFSAWSEGTPKQKKLITAILKSPSHIIATMRQKTEWEQQTDDKGKKRPVKLGMAPEQGKGIEYEFDMLMEINQDNIARIDKDRTSKFHGAIIEKPGEEFGKQLKEWLSTGVDPEVKPIFTTEEAFKIVNECKTVEDLGRAWKEHSGKLNFEDQETMKVMCKAKKNYLINSLMDETLE